MCCCISSLLVFCTNVFFVLLIGFCDNVYILYEVALKEISQCLSKLIFQSTDIYENMVLQNAVYSD